MPDSRRHRGPNPRDAQLFAEGNVPALQAAVRELSWLLSRGYALLSGLKLVGDRHALQQRQRQAVARCACSEQARLRRRETCVSEITGERLVLDGFNVLLGVEVALGGGVSFIARDGCLRDIASVHGSYRRVEETTVALECIGRSLLERNVAEVRVILDAPVSNSGRLAGTIRQLWAEWLSTEVVLSDHADRELRSTTDVVVSADSAILDQARAWTNLTRWIVERHVPNAWVVDLSAGTLRYEESHPAHPLPPS